MNNRTTYNSHYNNQWLINPSIVTLSVAWSWVRAEYLLSNFSHRAWNSWHCKDISLQRWFRIWLSFWNITSESMRHESCFHFAIFKVWHFSRRLTFLNWSLNLNYCETVVYYITITLKENWNDYKLEIIWLSCHFYGQKI